MLFTNLKQIHNTILSSTLVDTTPKEITTLKSFSMVSEAINSSIVDYVWLHVFTKVCPGVLKLKEQTNSRFRKSTTPKEVFMPVAMNSTKAWLQLQRKIKWCLLQSKDTNHIISTRFSTRGEQTTRILNCEKYCETRLLGQCLVSYLEDIRFSMTLHLNDNKITTYKYLLALYGVNANANTKHRKKRK